MGRAFGPSHRGHDEYPPAALDIRAQELKRIRLLPAASRRITRSQHGYANKLCVLLGLKEGREADAVVVVVDRDGERNKDRIEELNKGRDILQENGQPCAVGVAVELIEAWLLADEVGLRHGLGDDAIQRQPDPESLTSRDEKSEQNPKGRLQRIIEKALGDCPESIDFPAHYAAIAGAAKFETIEERCPAGFAPFSRQVRTLRQAEQNSK